MSPTKNVPWPLFFEGWKRNALSALAIAALLCGCGPRISIPRLGAEDVSWIEASGNYPHGTYRIEPGDTIQIRSTFHPEMDQREQVRPDGKIRAREVGEIGVAGLTTTEVASLLLSEASSRLRDPEMVVSVIEFSPKSVYVAGEVANPGPIPYEMGLTPLQAIIQAGGLLPTALPEGVALIRAIRPEGRTVSRLVDVESAVRRGVREPLLLAPHDVLYVPKTSIAEADLWVDQHFTQLFPFLRGVGANARVPGSSGGSR